MHGVTYVLMLMCCMMPYDTQRRTCKFPTPLKPSHAKFACPHKHATSFAAPNGAQIGLSCCVNWLLPCRATHR